MIVKKISYSTLLCFLLLIFIWPNSILANTGWEDPAAAPSTISYGGDATVIGNYVYVLRGHASSTFWRYSINDNKWETLANAPSSVGYGGCLAWDGGDYIYVLRGYNSRTFWRYSISANSWETRNNTPGNIYYGGDMVFDGTYFYAIAGNNYQYFYQYDPIYRCMDKPCLYSCRSKLRRCSCIRRH